MQGTRTQHPYLPVGKAKTQAGEEFAPASRGACTQDCMSQVSGHIHPVTPQARDPFGKPPGAPTDLSIRTSSRPPARCSVIFFHPVAPA